MIEQVDYDLHPFFIPRSERRFAPGLELTRIDERTFDVRCQIHWCTGLALPPKSMVKTLVLAVGGARAWTTLDVPFDRLEPLC